MSRLGFKSVVYYGDVRLGELDAIPATDQNFQFPNNEIRIQSTSPPSERCSPLSVLQTISSFSLSCKLQSSLPVEQPHLIQLHYSCFHELKTAIVLVGDKEIHLVAMPSRQKNFPCFWCFAVPCGLYLSCLGMLNLRCLAIVFELDETLIVANTMNSFEDQIEALRVRIAQETNPLRISVMSAELEGYMDDRLLLKQYIENDIVIENERIYKVQLEEVPPLNGSCEKVVRPIIRLLDKNIVLTRINPEIRDTSVLVRLRPAWEDLRSYLTAGGRKQFEVYVCTMAKRDYALEMWRLLDPKAHLIATEQLLDRVVCVKSGFRKSLLNVFQSGTCHPKMAIVIDDRSKVWEDRDQPHVYVVPAFTPYYAPQVEIANVVPALFVAGNDVSSVKDFYFKEFDEILLQRICEISYEDDVVDLPLAPDVSSYMISQKVGFVPNENVNALVEGMNALEVEVGDGLKGCYYGPKIFQLHKESWTTCQGSMSVWAYYTKLKTIWHELDELREYRPLPVCCGSKPIRDYLELERVMVFLIGLNDSYKNVRAQILRMKPFPSLNKVLSLILEEELQLSLEFENSFVNPINFMPSMFHP